MDLGLACSFRTTGGDRLGPALAQAGRAAEDLGFASWWAAGDREVAADRSHDPTLGLQCVARETTVIRLGCSGDILSTEVAAVRAKRIASLDWFGRGRVELGLDLARPPAALADPFRPVDDHVGLAVDRLAAMRQLWTQRRATHEGEHVSFAGAIALPKPVGDRVPATHLRATTPDVLERYVAACGAPHGWLAWLETPGELVAGVEALTQVLGEAADDVRRTWFVRAADLAASRDAVAGLQVRVDEVVAYVDHVPTPTELTGLAGLAGPVA
ncbi:LLM class flavin-dependent oxidoreductase [Nocardioides sp. LMS-CY]|uniref:LLM class flavin-dependent oxidoreductase n=1 Tax=Nocardioides sp. (strain LMS-CY) TaxID=2840457 RepID=UPI001C005AB8|nr:LLM class flavin-dependent oxidoreductase [Nocardioides sp. LMS-CY]QWF22786.1 LLM class flavin-dependent oxidoreductase [Nocardioides sp. LMS-CY]